MSPGVIVLGVLAGFLLIYVATGVKIVRPYQRGVVEQLGKTRHGRSGLRIIVPFVQKIRLVDMREQVIDVPPQEVITKDNVVVSVDAVLYYEPTDPQRLSTTSGTSSSPSRSLPKRTCEPRRRDQLDEALTSRDSINTALRQILDEATDKWGVRVARVEIQRIDPPPDVMSAMHEQMKAERTRRAASPRPRAAARPPSPPPRVTRPPPSSTPRASASRRPRGRGPGRGHPQDGRRREVPAAVVAEGEAEATGRCTTLSTRASPTRGSSR